MSKFVMSFTSQVIRQCVLELFRKTYIVSIATGDSFVPMDNGPSLDLWIGHGVMESEISKSCVRSGPRVLQKPAKADVSKFQTPVLIPAHTALINPLRRFITGVNLSAFILVTPPPQACQKITFRASMILRLEDVPTNFVKLTTIGCCFRNLMDDQTTCA
jgi:hypothetical protein